MQAPVAETADNWVQVKKAEDGQYFASVGKEIYDVTVHGQHSRRQNPLSGDGESGARRAGTCKDAALTQCSAAQPRTILRHVEIALQPRPACGTVIDFPALGNVILLRAHPVFAAEARPGNERTERVETSSKLSKLYPSAEAAFQGVMREGMLLAIGGFGLAAFPKP